MCGIEQSMCGKGVPDLLQMASAGGGARALCLNSTWRLSPSELVLLVSFCTSSSEESQPLQLGMGCFGLQTMGREARQECGCVRVRGGGVQACVGVWGWGGVGVYGGVCGCVGVCTSVCVCSRACSSIDRQLPGAFCSPAHFKLEDIAEFLECLQQGFSFLTIFLSEVKHNRSSVHA